MNIEIQDLLSSLQYQPDDNWQHVTILDHAVCRECKNKQCLNFCPAGVFRESSQKKQPLLILYKQCVECGGCRLICDNIDFCYPQGGYGVAFREG